MSLETWSRKFTESQNILGLICLAMVISMAGCTAEAPAPEPESAPEPEMPAAEPESMAPRVFFIEPGDGATVQSPVDFTFGAERFTIEPVGDGEIHDGAGHHHLGVDTDCLPVGEIIPEGNPWIHFGDASTEISMQLEAGTHRFCLQPGDGEHRTLADLSAVVTITVE